MNNDPVVPRFSLRFVPREEMERNLASETGRRTPKRKAVGQKPPRQGPEAETGKNHLPGRPQST